MDHGVFDLAEHAHTTSRNKPPISRHPLFPATVALWFGALFGLGSMALRPSLIESAMLAAHIDTLVPAIAPPLGMTTRILLALVMAGIGGLIGAKFAHHVAQPKSAAPQRKRRTSTVSSLAEGQEESRPGSEASCAIDADREARGDDGHSYSPVRRRALAIEQQTERRDFDERAPLPGGAPQIFNVSESGLERLEEPTQFNAESTEGRAETALDLSSYEFDDSAGEAPSAGNDVAEPEEAAEEPYTPAFSSPEHRRFDAPEALDIEPASDEQAELPAPPPVGRPFAEPSSYTAPEPAQSFEPTPVEPEMPDEPRASFVPPAEFANPWLTQGDASADDAGTFGGNEEPMETQDDQASDWNAREQHWRDGEPPAPTEREAEIETVPVPTGTAAERIASADLSELSHVELLERLALSLERRRQGAVPQSDLPPAETDDSFEPGPAIPQPYSPETAPASTFGEAPEPEPWADRQEPDYEDAEGETEPSGFDDQSREPTAPPPAEIPAALRPIGIDDEDVEDSFPGLVIQRHLAMPPDAPAAAREDDAGVDAPAHVDASSAEQAGDTGNPSAGDDPEDSDDENRVLEEGYSSLLNLRRTPQENGQQKQQFVRIDEPEPQDAAIEPVVIFPGHKPAHDDAFDPPFAASAETRADDTPIPTERPFDAPKAAAAQGLAVKAASANSPNPEETEKALRAALATLQKMSGAA